jgi:hypothetical protein
VGSGVRLKRFDPTCVKPHKHWGSRGISGVRGRLTKNYKFFVKLKIKK